MAVKTQERPTAPVRDIESPAARLNKLNLTRRVASENGVPEAYLETIISIVSPNANDSEIAAFVHQIARTSLDPMARQIYLVGRWDSQTKREKFTVQVGIDGYRLVADRTGLYAGSSDVLYDEGLTQYQWLKTGRENIKTATVTVGKLLSSGQIANFTATALWDSYHPGDRGGYMWGKMPFLMLGKVAEALALRKAFPAQLSGLYITEEMEQAGETPDTLNVIASELGYQNKNAVPTMQKLESVPGFEDEWFEKACGVTLMNVPGTEEGDNLLRKAWSYATEVAKGTAKAGVDEMRAYIGVVETEEISS